MEQGKITKRVAFYEGNSWCHRIKVLREDGSTLYSKRGGFASAEEAEASFYKCQEAFEKACRKQQAAKKDKDISLENYLRYWLEEVFSPRVENTTRMLAAYTLYKLIIPCLEQDIKLKYVNVDFLNELLGRTAKICASAGNKSRELLNLAFKEAVIEGYMKDNPIPSTTPYRRKKPNVVVLSKKELKRFLRVAHDSEWYLEILLGIFCGLRKGEIYGLKFCDWDEISEVIHIRRQITSNPIVMAGNGNIESYETIEKPPKSENSYRSLRIPSVVSDELRRRRDLVNQRKEKMGDLYEDHDYISAQANGRSHSISSMNIALTKLCKRNGFAHISVHSLRHMYASILLEQQVPIAKISALLSHSSVHTTFEYYADIIDENNNIMAFINNNFRPGGGE